MDKYFLKNHIQEVEENFKINNVDCSFSDYQALLKSDLKQEKLYLNNCSFNQTKTLSIFMQLLYEKFGDSFLINNSYIKEYTIINRDNSDNKIIYKGCFCSGCYITFSINNYIYYLQFDRNPFFDENSYISTHKIYKFDNNIIYQKFKNKYFKKEYYSGAKEIYNINNCIVDLYSSDCDCEKSAQNLFNYFMDKCFENESIRYNSKDDERIFLIDNNKNVSNIVNIYGDEKI